MASSMASSNHGCYSRVTVKHHSIAGTPAFHTAYTPPPLQTVCSLEAVPSGPDFDDLFLFSDLGFGDPITQPESLPTMEDSEEELWLEEEAGDSVSVSGNLLHICSDCDKSCVTSGDLSSSSGSVVSSIDFSSFSLPFSPTISFNSQLQPDSSFISGDLSSSSGTVVSNSDFSSFSNPFSPTISFNSQLQPDSSFCPLPTTSASTHPILQKEARKKSQKEEEEEEEEGEAAVMFIVEGDLNVLYDGYTWRKYGEKSIKHRNYRRSYYRCGHDGCKVKKQVEQSTENPATYLITYYGRHNHYTNTNFSSIGYN